MRNKRIFAVQVVTDPAEAMRRVVYGAGALEASSEAVGVSHQTLSKQLNEEDGAGLSLRRAAAIEQFMDSDALAECFAARRRGLFVKLPDLNAADLPAAFVRGYGTLVTAFAAASRDFSAAVEDGRFTSEELERFRKDLQEVYKSGEMLVRLATASIAETKA
jgi:hypothetical protein